jgi:hypothetical protein
MSKLTAPIICREFVRILSVKHGAGAAPLQKGLYKFTANRHQKYVDFYMTKNFEELNWTLEEFSQRLILPSANAIAREIPAEAMFLKMELSDCKYVAQEDFNDISVRFIMDTTILPDEVDLKTGETLTYKQVWIGRFDILYEIP